jgi:hypothetical protein
VSIVIHFINKDYQQSWLDFWGISMSMTNKVVKIFRPSSIISIACSKLNQNKLVCIRMYHLSKTSNFDVSTNGYHYWGISKIMLTRQFNLSIHQHIVANIVIHFITKDFRSIFAWTLGNLNVDDKSGGKISDSLSKIFDCMFQTKSEPTGMYQNIPFNQSMLLYTKITFFSLLTCTYVK